MENTGNKYLNVTGNGNVVLPAGQLVRIVVNKAGGSGNTAQIYNATEAQGADASLKVGNLDTTSVRDVEYQIPLITGIFIVVGGGTTPDLTVVYRPL